MSDASELTCVVPGCGGPASGVCINGLTFEECPDVVPVGSFEVSALDRPQAADTSPLVVTQRSSSLDAAACDALLRDKGGAVVALVAGPGAGKTTLIATIYELARRGRMARFGFAGSETIRGFEERCYLARTASDGTFPDTPRTPRRAALSFAHLRLATATATVDLVMSDRSGEHFDDLLARPGRAVEFPELVRATVVLQLVDAERLSNAQHLETSRSRRLFGAMSQSGALDGKPLLLVATKSDLLVDEGAERSAADRLEALRADLERRGAGRTRVTAHMTASRARPGSAVIGSCLEDLVAALLDVPPPPRYAPHEVEPRTADPLSFLMARLGRY